MTWLAKFRCALHALFHRNQAEWELSDELQAHLEMQVEANVAAGMSPGEARLAALRSFGGVDLAKEQCRDTRGLAFIDRFAQDLRFAIRQLFKYPGFSATVALTIGLGIGATTAIFSVVKAALLEPPPYPQPDRIFALGAYGGNNNQDGQTFHYIRERSRAFEHIAAHGIGTGWNLVAGEQAEYVAGLAVSEGFFDVLGVAPLLGRDFVQVEDQANGPRAVVISEALWQRLFAANPKAIGETVLLGGEPYTIVGVMPGGFRTTPAADFWTPLRLSSADSSTNYTVLGRLRQDVSEAQAQRELESVRVGILRDLQGIPKDRTRTLQWVSYQRWLGFGRYELLLLFGAVLFLLLIACVNVASLQLVRAISHRREMATRSALGGSKGRLVQQVLTESVLMGIVGAAIGTVMAHWGLRGLLQFVPAWLLEGRTVDLDWRVLIVTLAAAVGVGILSGIVPAFTVARLNVRTILETTRGTPGRPTMWLRRGFAVTEMALAVVLLVGTGLLIRTFANLRNVELGFDPSNVVIGKMSLRGSSTQTKEQIATFFERTLARLRETSGIASAAVGNNVPVEQNLNLPLEPPVGGLVGGTRAIDWNYVTSGYFAVFGIPVRAGRAFDEGDRAESAPVALINESFARTYFGTAPAIGWFVQIMQRLGDPPRQIVGVVADVKARSSTGWSTGYNAIGSNVGPAIYVPASQVPANILELAHSFYPINWSVRTEGNVDALSALQGAVRSVDSRLPFIGFETMEQVIARDLEMQRFLMTLVGIFSFLSLTLATIGVYGLFAYTAGQRKREIGIRIALGARRIQILHRFLVEGLSLAIFGILIGLVTAIPATRLLSSQIFGISRIDFLTFSAVAALLTLVVGIATLIPAVRAANVDPVVVLKAE